jgi:(2Fe-2S) ferredoxin
VQRRFDVRVCRGPVCAGEREADAVHARLAELLAAHGLGDAVELERQSCFGRCRLGPNVHVGERLPPELLAAAALPGSAERPRKLSAFYNGVSPDDAGEIVAAHLLGGRVVERLIYRIPGLSQLEPAPAGEPAGAIPPAPTAAGPAPADTASRACNDPEPPADVVRDPR